MSLLVLTGDGKERAHEVALYAARLEHWYRPGESDFVPGDREEYVAHFQSYRCVFSITEMDGDIFRHLSISVPRPARGALPNPLAAFTIASWFGFTGGQVSALGGDIVEQPGADWMMETAREPAACVILAQRIGVSR